MACRPCLPEARKDRNMATIENIEDFEGWKGSRIVDAHGRPRSVFKSMGLRDISDMRMPAFFTDSLSNAEGFLDGQEGVVVEAFLSIKNPFMTGHSREECMAFIELAGRAGVVVTVSETKYGWSFDAPEISEHSPFDGTNLNHLVYIPAVQEQLKKEGYDGLIASETVANYEIEAFVVLSHKQVLITRVHIMNRDREPGPGM